MAQAGFHLSVNTHGATRQGCPHNLHSGLCVSYIAQVSAEEYLQNQERDLILICSLFGSQCKNQEAGEVTSCS